MVFSVHFIMFYVYLLIFWCVFYLMSVSFPIFLPASNIRSLAMQGGGTLPPRLLPGSLQLPPSPRLLPRLPVAQSTRRLPHSSKVYFTLGTDDRLTVSPISFLLLPFSYLPWGPLIGLGLFHSVHRPDTSCPQHTSVCFVSPPTRG